MQGSRGANGHVPALLVPPGWYVWKFPPILGNSAATHSVHMEYVVWIIMYRYVTP